MSNYYKDADAEISAEPTTSDSLNKRKFGGVAGRDLITVRAVMTLVGACLIQLIVGAQLAMGNITVYFSSYYRLTMNDESVEGDTFLPILPCTVIVATFVIPVGNKLVDCMGGRTKPVLIIGSLFALMSTAICALMPERLSPVGFMVILCVGMGIFIGFLKCSLLRAGWSHLPERKGLVAGAIISGYGFGGFIFGILA